MKYAKPIQNFGPASLDRYRLCFNFEKKNPKLIVRGIIFGKPCTTLFHSSGPRSEWRYPQNSNSDRIETSALVNARFKPSFYFQVTFYVFRVHYLWCHCFLCLGEAVEKIAIRWIVPSMRAPFGKRLKPPKYCNISYLSGKYRMKLIWKI